jgi:hypothetical protein
VKLTTHLQLVPRSRKCGSIHPLPHTPSWRSARGQLYFLLYMFRPQRVVFRCSTYITLPLYCALTHFLFQVATSMYIQPPACSITLMALFHALWPPYNKMLKYFKIYTNMFNKTVIKHRLKFVNLSLCLTN